MENYEYLYATSTGIYVISGLILVTACVLLYTKIRTIATILILIGSVSAFILNIVSIFMGAIAGQYDVDTYIKINAITNIISGLAYGIFCIGLLLFVVNDLKKRGT